MYVYVLYNLIGLVLESLKQVRQKTKRRNNLLTAIEIPDCTYPEIVNPVF